MMKTSRLSTALMTSFGLLLAISAASPDCWAQEIFVLFRLAARSTDFHIATNWTPDRCAWHHISSTSTAY